MQNTQKPVRIKVDAKNQISNKIVRFLITGEQHSLDAVESKSVANNVVIMFIIGLIFLFSALEEADWNVLSAQTNHDEIIIDKSGWYVLDIIGILNSRDQTIL